MTEKYTKEYFQLAGKKGGKKTAKLYPNKAKEWGKLGKGKRKKLTELER
jgi:hypothetical protein